jgi:predicted phosphodiesterase
MKKLKKPKKIAVFPDMHCPYEDKRAFEVAMKIVSWYRPDEIIILGDFLDCGPVSHWNRKNLRERNGMSMAADFAVANKYLDQMQAICPNLTYIRGNHEKWLDDAMDEAPELAGLLDLDINLKFKERKVRDIPFNGIYTLGYLSFTHGIYTNSHHALTHVQKFGRSIVYGHLHDVQMAISVSPVDVEDKHMGLSLGCLAAINPRFMKNRPSNWQHCIGIGMIRPDGGFNIDPVIISRGAASYAGKTFKAA